VTLRSPKVGKENPPPDVEPVVWPEEEELLLLEIVVPGDEEEVELAVPVGKTEVEVGAVEVEVGVVDVKLEVVFPGEVTPVDTLVPPNTKSARVVSTVVLG
jgi:hypothetical protein